MDSITGILVGALLGLLLIYIPYILFKKKRNKSLVNKQSTILLDRIQKVCKLISVEGDFSEIFTYEDTTGGLMNMLSSKKKALMVINAKAHVGYDFKKVKLEADNRQKQIILTHFPQPEIISVEPEIKFYDMKNGWFNTFSSEDLTKMNLEAKNHIREKVPESGLMETARNEALQTILIMEKIVETIGWSFDYTALNISPKETKEIENR